MRLSAIGRDMSKVIKASVRANKGKPNLKISKAVVQYDLNNNFINEFQSITQANKALNKTSKSISNCLIGRAKTAFGYIWKYKNINGR